MSDHDSDRAQMIEKAQDGIRVLGEELMRLTQQAEQAEYARKQMEEAAGKLQALHEQLSQTIGAAASQLEADRVAMKQAAEQLTSAAPDLVEQLARSEKALTTGLSALQDAVDKRMSETRGQLGAALADQAQKTIYAVEDVAATTSRMRRWLVAVTLLSLLATAGSWVAAVLLIRR